MNDLSVSDQARALFAQGNYTEAEKLFRDIATAAPGDAAAHYNWGVVLAKLEKFEQALGCYRAAITLNPAFAAAYTNFGFCLNALGLIAQARQGFSIARSLAPDDPILMLNEGIAALALGDYAAGWPGFAARWQLPAYAKFKRAFDKPFWRGQDLNGKKLFLYAEQGFGDTIQMARYLPLLAARGGDIIVEVPPALTALMQSVGAATILTKGDPLPDFDFYCALMDVPAAVGTTIDTIPAAIPYLHADADQTALYQARLPRSNVKRVGLSWAGRSSHENDCNRSLALKRLMPIVARCDIEWVSLQRIVPAQDKEDLQNSVLLDWGQAFPDFAATAAAMMTLDLVITVDSAVAHLAGALGKPVWILLPFYADWRWLTGREDSPWYPTARLFRQKKRGHWKDVVDRVSNALASLIPDP